MKMEGRRRKTKRVTKSSYVSSSSSSEEEIIIRKGPWKAEEDEVVLKHVSKFGPRDWSSLLSKGLLRRTGKSCRLRWVNKLRPNLKNGCKFSAEEERVVIELQAQLGNKWAKIATYLPGRTDNDVKNFWSSRQKRLARLFHDSQQQNAKSLGPHFDPPAAESCSKAESGTSLEMVIPLHSMIQHNDVFELPPITTKTSLNLIPVDQQNNTECSILNQQKDLAFLEPQSDHEFIGNLDLDFMGVFPRVDNCIASGDIVEYGDDQMTNYEQLDGEQGATNNLLFYQIPLSPDSFFGDLPSDIFDQMEHIPSPP
ncbi:hypothetical protein V2J09_002474 [Rumex salicifolius]